MKTIEFTLFFIMKTRCVCQGRAGGGMYPPDGGGCEGAASLPCWLRNPGRRAQICKGTYTYILEKILFVIINLGVF